MAYCMGIDVPDAGVQEYSIWLLPEPAQQACLDQKIRSLAPVFGTASFPAHLTVLGDVQGTREALGASVQKLAAAFSSFWFDLRGVHASAEYFRSFYLLLAEAPEFGELCGRASTLTGSSSGLPPFPHVSLGYGEPVDPFAKGRLQRAFKISDNLVPLHFDRIVLARSSKNIPISDWAILQVCACPGGRC